MPPLMLQPLVENAIKHGIAPCEAGGRLHIGSRIEAGLLLIEVSNTGEPLTVAPTPTDGRAHVGLANLRDRLATLCGPAGSLKLAKAPDGSTVATLRLPFTATA
jgi:LytS/YehU family sensor histidine kinase